MGFAELGSDVLCCVLAVEVRFARLGFAALGSVVLWQVRYAEGSAIKELQAKEKHVTNAI